MVANAGGMIMTTTKQKSQLPPDAIAFAWERQRKGAISALYKNGSPTQANPKRVLNRNRKPAPTSWQVLSVVLVRPPIMQKQQPIPKAVQKKDLRRPRPSMRNTETREQKAYSRPPIAATRCDRLGERSKDSCKILFAYVEQSWY
jgi:hypothetical protein